MERHIALPNALDFYLAAGSRHLHETSFEGVAAQEVDVAPAERVIPRTSPTLPGHEAANGLLQPPRDDGGRMK